MGLAWDERSDSDENCRNFVSWRIMTLSVCHQSLTIATGSQDMREEQTLVEETCRFCGGYTFFGPSPHICQRCGAVLRAARDVDPYALASLAEFIRRERELNEPIEPV